MAGSRLLMPFSKKFGIPIDYINYFASQIFCIILAILFKSIINRKVFSESFRHLTASILGCLLVHFCFGMKSLATVILFASIMYAALYLPLLNGHITLLSAMAYLANLKYQLVWYGNMDEVSINHTTVIMIFVQKITSLQYSLVDGQLSTAEREKLRGYRKKQLLEKIPSIFEYFGFLFSFWTIMSGPMIFFKDYQNMMKNPERTRASYSKSFKKILLSIMYMVVGIKLEKVFKLKNLFTPGVISTMSFIEILLFSFFANISARLKYIFAWTVSDGINNLAGFGFNGESNEWDLATNINFLKFELGSNPRAINDWNINTSKWLRHVGFERSTKVIAPLVVFSLSAVWHGFYAGYYVLFSYVFVWLELYKKYRKCSLKRMIDSLSMKNRLFAGIYNSLTIVVFQLLINYVGTCFQLKSLERSMIFMRGSNFYGHWSLLIASLIVIF